MLIHLLRQSRQAERVRLRDFLATPRCARRPEYVAWVLQQMDAYGSLEYGRRVAHALAGAARYECASLYAGFPDSRDRRFIEALPVLGARAT
jgi:hypothetical protein